MGYLKTKEECLEMRGMTYDLAVLGSGFGGSLCALIAKKQGKNVILFDKSTHPRFAIGESSTPQADLMLAQLADTYELEYLKPFASYGSWKRNYPDIPCGPKRGFSYFNHQPDGGELLVAANMDLEHADTHWYRSSFDTFLAAEVRNAEIPLIENVEVNVVQSDDHCIQFNNESIEANFVIDATGGSNPLNIEQSQNIHTNTRALFAHFGGVAHWGDLHPNDKHPFQSHHSALHHIIEGGWMYVLHFDNGVTSAGFVLDIEHHPITEETPEEEWERLLGLYPDIASQFKQSTQKTPLVKTTRMQRKSVRCAGSNWAMLPSAAYLIDPLHSTGNAHTLFCIERLMHAFLNQEPLDRYEQLLFSECSLIDELVSGSYGAMRHFDSFVNFTMLYFAGADFSERKRMEEGHSHFLNSQDEQYRAVVSHWAHEARLGQPIPNLKDEIAPWNCVGLCDESKQNMYDYA